VNVPSSRPARIRRAVRRASAAAGGLGLAVLGLVGGGLAGAGPALAAAQAAPALTASATTVASGATVTFSYSTPSKTLSTSNWIGIYSAGQTPGDVASTSWQNAPNASGTVTFSTTRLSGAGSYDVYFLYNNAYQVLAGPLHLTVTGKTPAPAPRFTGSFGGTGAGRLAAPYGVAAGADAAVWVADRSGNRVEEFGPGGRLVRAFGSSGPDPLEHPEGVAIGPDGSIWVSDTGHGRLVEFSPDGREEAVFGSSGSGKGQLDQPEGLAIGPLGSVYVADQGNSRVEKFGIGGRFLSSIPVARPAGVAITGTGNLWVTSPSPPHGTVQEFGPDGTLLADDTSTPGGSGAPSYPAGIAVGPDGHIYVTQPDFGIVTVLNPDGSFFTKFGRQDTARARQSLRRPEGIAVGPDGTVWVADSGNGRIAEYAPARHDAAAPSPIKTDGNRFVVALLIMALFLLVALAVGFLVRRPWRGRKAGKPGPPAPLAGGPGGPAGLPGQ
jgi:sugar lactone lactonase YvrE